MTESVAAALKRREMPVRLAPVCVVRPADLSYVDGKFAVRRARLFYRGGGEVRDDVAGVVAR